MKEKMIVFVKKETVLVVAAILAVMSAFFVHPDQAYIDYIDFRVLGILLSLMIIMAGVQNNGIFDGIGRRLLAHTKNTAQLAFVLVFLCNRASDHSGEPWKYADSDWKSAEFVFI